MPAIFGRRWIMLQCACGLNPNETQSKQQQKWEAEFIAKRGQCSACENEQNRLIFSASSVVFGIIFAGILICIAWKVG